MFDVPGWAIGAVTVVVLLAVFLYPREDAAIRNSPEFGHVGKRPKTEGLATHSETRRNNHCFERFSPRARSNQN